MIVGYTLYKQISPLPAYPYNRFPYYAGAYLLIGLGIVTFVPGFARRIGERLTAETTDLNDEDGIALTPAVDAQTASR